MRDSVVDAGTMPDLAGHAFYYKAAGTVKIGGGMFYVVYNGTDRDALDRGEYDYYSALAVGADGRLIFMQGEDVRWTLVHDAGQKFITPD